MSCPDLDAPQSSTIIIGPADGRESAGAVLRHLAEKLTRQADTYTRLAEVADQLAPGSPSEKAMWEIAIESTRSIR